MGHTGTHFYVEKDGLKKLVNPYDVDQTLRSIPKNKLPQFFQHGYVSVNQLSNGDYKLNAHVRGQGGGPLGASVGGWLGWTLTHVVCHGIIHLGCRGADLVVPGSGATAEVGLHAAAQPYIFGAAKVVALNTGMIGAIFTGPA